MEPITFAHRGARLEEPENTIPAFRRALEAGAGGLESDAWLSRRRRGRARPRRQSSGPSCGGGRCRTDAPRSSPRSPSPPGRRLRGAGTELRALDRLKDRAAFDPMLAVAERPERSSGCGSAHHALGLLAAKREEHLGPARALAAARGTSVPRSSGTPTAQQPRHRRDEHAPQRLDRGVSSRSSTASTCAPSRGTCRRCATCAAALRMHVDGIYCDRPDRMVATVGEWARVKPKRLSGHILTNAWPMIVERVIGPNTRESEEATRCRPS